MKREPTLTREEERLRESEARTAHWKRWGPYLSERAWGTVREDYSPNGAAWEYLPHDHARSRAYRWNEDGYFDVFVEYAKADVEDLLVRITAVNRGPEAASLHLLPTLWFRNTWCWKGGTDHAAKPRLGRAKGGAPGVAAV